jgi:hypothetical protein
VTIVHIVPIPNAGASISSTTKEYVLLSGLASGHGGGIGVLVLVLASLVLVAIVLVVLVILVLVVVLVALFLILVELQCAYHDHSLHHGVQYRQAAPSEREKEKAATR